MLFLLDASAILNDFNFSFNQREHYLTTNKVFDECRDFRSRNLMQAALSRGVLLVRDPARVSEQQARLLANSLENKFLSPADLSVLGVALELLGKESFVLVTDDHGLQFVCKRAGIPCTAIIRGNVRKKPVKSGKKAKFVEKSVVGKKPKNTEK